MSMSKSFANLPIILLYFHGINFTSFSDAQKYPSNWDAGIIRMTSDGNVSMLSTELKSYKVMGSSPPNTAQKSSNNCALSKGPLV